MSDNARKLKLQIKKNGYKVVSLSKKYFYVHRLVLENFVGECPQGSVARHKNGIKTDNRLDNLCWGTFSENNGIDRVLHGTSNRGSRHGGSKLNETKVLNILSLIGKISQTAIAKLYQVDPSTISKIRTGKTWTQCGGRNA